MEQCAAGRPLVWLDDDLASVDVWPHSNAGAGE